MITFKKFLVEKIVGNTGWVYHRTPDDPEESSIVTHGIKPSTNQSAMYGRGLYCCYDINQQLKPDMEQYGEYILKGKIDLNGFAILDYEIYGLANPRGNFQEHLKQIGTNMESMKDTIPYTSRIAQNIWEKCKANGYNGIIFTGESDGKVAVIWNRRNFIPYQYSKDNAATWKTLTPDIKSIKRPHDPEYDKDDQAIKFSKILKELSRKEEIGDLEFPDSYKNKIFLKNLKKSGNIIASYTAEINLPQLQTSGDIDASYATELNLPQLQKSGYIRANNATELNLPQLQESGGIGADNATEINLPQLQKSGYIDANNATELNLPQLQTSGSIGADNATEINLPQLQKSGYIDANNATELNLPQLQTSGDISAKNATELNLPQLQKSGYIDASYATELNLPQLQKSGYISAYKAAELNLPQLQMCKGITTYSLDELNLPELIHVEYGSITTDALRLNLPKLAGITVGKIEATKVTKLDLPNLRSCGGIDAPLTIYLNLPELMLTTETIHVPNAITLNMPKLGPSLGTVKAPKAKKIIIPKESVSILKNVPKDCEIIHPEDAPQVKVDENTTFKKYLMLKESLVQIPLDTAYEIFKNEYDKSTGTSWSYEKFMGRARAWEFYGDEKGYVAIRRQRSGLVKLVGMAGDNRSKLKGINDLISMNMPLWGMVSKDIKDIAVRRGMREPNFLERQVLKRSIPPEVLGGAEILEYQKDGGIKLQYPDVGIVVKYLVGTPQYYAKLRTMIGDKVKEKILG
jgi:hypothetical protein